MAKSIDGNNYSSQNIVSGDNILICVGPPEISTSSGVNKINIPEIGAPAEEGQDVYLVGLVQNWGTQTGRPQRQLAELGGKGKYLLSSRGQKKINIGRIITDTGNTLKALYRYYISDNELQDSLPGNIWMSLDHPIFKDPIGVMVSLGRINPNGEREEIERIYLENTTIENIGGNFQEGDRGMLENVTMMWSNTKTLSLK